MSPGSVVHIVVTGNFAGAERYVCNIASETANRGWRVTVIGGHPGRMRGELAAAVHWLPGANIATALRSAARAGQHDICHVHMTYAEAVGALARPFHQGKLIATRHFAAHRGATLMGRVLAPLLERKIERQIAISQFVNDALERPADAVIVNGTPTSRLLWTPQSRRVLVLQRLEPEKHTELALEAWQLSGLAGDGWTLRIVGNGSQRADLTALAADLQGVTVAGATDDVDSEFSKAGMLLATAPAEPLGLSAIEAAAAGIPVIAVAAGGHLETIGRAAMGGRLLGKDAVTLARQMQALARDEVARGVASGQMRELHSEVLGLDIHVDRVLCEYIRSSRSEGASESAGG